MGVAVVRAAPGERRGAPRRSGRSRSRDLAAAGTRASNTLRAVATTGPVEHAPRLPRKLLRRLFHRLGRVRRGRRAEPLDLLVVRRGRSAPHTGRRSRVPHPWWHARRRCRDPVVIIGRDPDGRVLVAGHPLKFGQCLGDGVVVRGLLGLLRGKSPG